MTDSIHVQPAERPITITRVFDAPPELVFRAWTDPDQLVKWFGPAGMEIPRGRVEIDLREGGRIELCMVRPSTEAEHWIRYEIVELAEPELLVLRSEAMPEMGLPDPVVTRIELHAEGGATRMTLTDGPFTEEGNRNAGAGWESAFQKLEQLLVGSASP